MRLGPLFSILHFPLLLLCYGLQIRGYFRRVFGLIAVHRVVFMISKKKCGDRKTCVQWWPWCEVGPFLLYSLFSSTLALLWVTDQRILWSGFWMCCHSLGSIYVKKKRGRQNNICCNSRLCIVGCFSCGYHYEISSIIFRFIEWLWVLWFNPAFGYASRSS